MNPFTKIVSTLTLLLISTASNASTITWDFEFEVSFIENTSNGVWTSPLGVGDTVTGSLSFSDNVLISSESINQTIFDASDIVFDIEALTSDAWLDNLSPNSWASHSSNRETVSMNSSYSIDSTSTGEINWEALSFSFRENNALKPYDYFPMDWGNIPVEFSYFRDLDVNSNISEVYITGNAISATQRVAVPEPTTALIFLLAICALSSRRLILK